MHYVILKFLKKTAGAGEMTRESLKQDEGSHIASIIAGEIVNEVLENALDIATRVSESALQWRNLATTVKSDHAAVCHDIVEKMVDNVENRPRRMSEIIGGPDKAKDVRQAAPLEIEVKKLLDEMKSSPYEVINYDIPSKGGIGDQPLTMEKISVPCPLPAPIEKKSRTTDLVKNSKQILTDIIKNESMKQTQEKFEENEEKLIQVIELDCVHPGDKPFKVPKKYDPTEIPLPQDDDELVEIPDDKNMDQVDLKGRQEAAAESSGGQGDDQSNNYSMIVVMSPNTSPGNEAPSDSQMYVGESSGISSYLNETSDCKEKKKKWNLASKFMGWLKKSKNASSKK